MEISDFTMRILLLFLPGIICYFIIDQLTVHKRKEVYEVFVLYFVLGFFSYIIYAFLLDRNLIFLKALTDKNIQICYIEIMKVTIFSIMFGIIISYVINSRIAFKIANGLKISAKDGYIDIWENIISKKNTRWIVARDLKNDLMYEGWIYLYSDFPENRELVIRDVIVFKNSTGEELYKISTIYLHSKENIYSIEFPNVPFTDMIKRTNTK